MRSAPAADQRRQTRERRAAGPSHFQRPPGSTQCGRRRYPALHRGSVRFEAGRVRPTLPASRCAVRRGRGWRRVARQVRGGERLCRVPGGDGEHLLSLLADDFWDNVSRQRGPDIWRLVATWLSDTFADVAVDLHSVAEDDDRPDPRLAHPACTHISSAFPFLRDLCPTDVASPVPSSTSSRSRRTPSSSTALSVVTSSFSKHRLNRPELRTDLRVLTEACPLGAPGRSRRSAP